MANLPVPELFNLEYFANSAFESIDTDKNKKLDVNEFLEWMNSNCALQDFILKYTGT